MREKISKILKSKHIHMHWILAIFDIHCIGNGRFETENTVKDGYYKRKERHLLKRDVPHKF